MIASKDFRGAVLLERFRDEPRELSLLRLELEEPEPWLEPPLECPWRRDGWWLEGVESLGSGELVMFNNSWDGFRHQ